MPDERREDEAAGGHRQPLAAAQPAHGARRYDQERDVVGEVAAVEPLGRRDQPLDQRGAGLGRAGGDELDQPLAAQPLVATVDAALDQPVGVEQQPPGRGQRDGQRRPAARRGRRRPAAAATRPGQLLRRRRRSGPAADGPRRARSPSAGRARR